MAISENDLNAIINKIQLLQQANSNDSSGTMKRLALLHVLQAISETYYAAHSTHSSMCHFRQILSHLSVATITQLFLQQNNQHELWESAFEDLTQLTNQSSTETHDGLPSGLQKLCGYLSHCQSAPISDQPPIPQANKKLLKLLRFTPSSGLSNYRQHRNAFYQDQNQPVKTIDKLNQFIALQMKITEQEARLYYIQDKHLAEIDTLAKKLVIPSIMKSENKSKLDKAIHRYNKRIEQIYQSNHFTIETSKVYQLHYSLHQEGYIQNIEMSLLKQVNSIRTLFGITTTAENELNDKAYTDAAREQKHWILEQAQGDCQYLANTHTQTRKIMELDLTQNPIRCFAARLAIALIWESMNSLVEYPQYQHLKMRNVRNYLFHSGVNNKSDRLLFMSRTSTYIDNSPRLVAQQLYIVTINLKHILSEKNPHNIEQIPSMNLR